VGKKHLLLWVIGVFFLFFMSFQTATAEIFRYKHIKGEKYKLITTVKERIYVDGELNNQAEFLNKIAVNTLDAKNNTGLLQGDFFVSEKAWGSSGIYRNDNTEETTQFWRDEQGKYTIAKEFLYPIVRGIPFFPKKELNIGDVWSAEAEEVSDLTQFGVKETLHIPLKVFYDYIDKKQFDAT
jgi:hypothetical protein